MKSLNIRYLLLLLIAIIFSLVHKPTYKIFKKNVARPVYLLFLQNTNLANNYFNDPVIPKDLPKQFYFINLDRSVERLRGFESQVQNLRFSFEKHKATEGLNIIFTENGSNISFSGKDVKNENVLLKKRYSYNVFCSDESFKERIADFEYAHSSSKIPIVYHKRILSIGEMGLLCSYNRLWKQISHSSLNQISVIFEDDVKFHENFSEEMDKVFAALPEKWDLVYLNYNESETEKKWIKDMPMINNHLRKYEDLRHNKWGTYAYMINSNSAKKLLHLQSKFGNIPADNLLMEGVKSGYLKTYIVDSKFLEHNFDIDSEIDKIDKRVQLSPTPK